MITYFKDKKHKSDKKNEKDKTLSTLLKSLNTFAIIATTSNSITMSLTGIGLKAIPITTATTCGLSIGNKVIYEIVMQKYNKYKKQIDNDQQTFKYFNKLYKKVYKIMYLIKVNMNKYVTFSINILMKKNESFIKMNIKKNFVLIN